jgi:hypothetical protein
VSLIHALFSRMIVMSTDICRCTPPVIPCMATVALLRLEHYVLFMWSLHGSHTFRPCFRVSHWVCPVDYVTLFLQHAALPTQRVPEAYLIHRVHTTKMGHVASKRKGISYTTVHPLFRETIQHGIPATTHYGFPSLRAGGTSAAAQKSRL